MKNMCFILSLALILLVFSGCRKGADKDTISKVKNETFVQINNKINKISNGFSSVRYDNDYNFEGFISQGGVKSESELVKFIKSNIEAGDINIDSNIFGCSTITTVNRKGERIFGRNFDWNKCNALVVLSKNPNYYASISTVNMDFVKQGVGRIYNRLSDEVKTYIAMYTPLDGMNEKGLCIAVNMIQDDAEINQNTDRPDITTTTALRLLLNKAANVDEAISLLEGYDMHSSMGMMVHFAIADSRGRSVVIEYIENKMYITETSVVTNFYLTEGEKYGIGTNQSHTRYDLLKNILLENPIMEMSDVCNALGIVSKGNFNEFESTQWSVVFNQNTGEVNYYHREEYDKCRKFNIFEE